MSTDDQRVAVPARADASPRERWLRAVRVAALVMVLLFLGGYVVAQRAHTTWTRGTILAVEQDLEGAIWPLAQSFDSSHGYGYTGDNPYPHLIEGDYGGTAFYPPGYPFLLWLTDKLVGDPERASQVINAFAAVLFIVATYWLGVAWTGRRGLGLLAAALAASGSVFLTLAYAASTDLLAAAGLTGALAFATWGLRSPARRRWIVLAGVTLGLAFLVRRQVAVMLVPLLVLAALSARGNRREAAVRAASVLGAFVVVGLPDFLIQASLHGSPFYGAHGKNIWNAVVNHYDWPNWHSVPNTISAVGVILSAPSAFVANWLGNLLYYAEREWIGPATYLALPGLVIVWRRHALAPRSMLVIGAAVFVVLVASISERGDRHAMILVPTLAVLAAAAVWYGVSRRWRIPVAAAVLAISLAVGLAHTAVNVTEDLQVPYLNQVVNALHDDGAQPSDVLTSFNSAHYAFYAGISFVPLSGDVVTWDDLRQFMQEHGVRYYVARGIGFQAKRLVESLEPTAAPDWITPIYASPIDRTVGRIVLYRYDGG
jgi:4-amino-4-deoxy-L-arabinose transferase-like glycosyltransferase